jgi:Histidine phosphatase superfamily (branch 1)
MIRTLHQNTFRRLRFAPSSSLTSSCHGFHDLLPETSARSDDISDIFKRAGISHVAFLRHGQTTPAFDGVDFNRKLTEEGRHQSKEAGRSFGRTIGPLFPVVVVSPAPRTIETAELFLAEALHETKSDPIQILPLQVAYDGTMQPEGSLLFKKLGYAPLLDYLNNDSDSDDKLIGKRILGKYASDIIQSILEIIIIGSHDNGSSDQPNGMTFLFVGHSIYLPAAAFGIACKLQCDDASKDILLKTVTGEAEGYLIDIDSRCVQLLKRSEIYK